MEYMSDIGRMDESLGGGLPLSPLLESFYAGSEILCPQGCGGLVHIVRVGTLTDGRGELWLECGCCAQRERVTIPAPTPAELEATSALANPGLSPRCPRHASRVMLRYSGRQLICPECGVRYRG